MPIEILHSAKTDIGLKRHHNEDRFYANQDLGLYVVCDGMGGENAGEVASTLAVDTIQAYMTDAARQSGLPFVGPYDATVSPMTNRLASAVRLANQTIHQESWVRPDCVGMGTTVVAAQLSSEVLSVAHVGDSRLYLVRNKTIHPLTTDHSWVAEQVLKGLLTEEEAEHSMRKNIVTRALGVESVVEVELGEVFVQSGDVLLLCSDGLTRGVRTPEILQVLRDEHNVESMANRLVALANHAGGDDNTTVLVVTIQQGDHAGLWKRFRTRFL
jgi:serine/threonine protein phosphatase PrpC